MLCANTLPPAESTMFHTMAALAESSIISSPPHPTPSPPPLALAPGHTSGHMVHVHTEMGRVPVCYFMNSASAKDVG